MNADIKRAVILDVDGTLLHSAEDDERLYRQAVTTVLGNVAFRPNLGAYDRVTDSGILIEIGEDNGLTLTEALIVDVQTAFVAGIAAHIDRHGPFEARPGAKRFIHRLKGSASIELAIATGGWRRSAEMKLGTAGFDTAGIPVATADDAIERTDIMRIALDSLPGSFEEVTYYGDAPWDREASRRLGWRFRAVGPALGGIDTFDDECPT